MKESEAKTKWCPHVRLSCTNRGNISASYNRQFGSISNSDLNATDEVVNCIASNCMMWESWEYEVKESITGEHDKVLIKNKGEGNCGLKPKELQCNV